MHTKSISVKAPYKLSVVRAIYLALQFENAVIGIIEGAPEYSCDLAMVLDSNIFTEHNWNFHENSPGNLHLEISFDIELYRIIIIAHYISEDPYLSSDIKRYFKYIFANISNMHGELKIELDKLKDNMMQANSQWWENNAVNWTKSLRRLMNNYRNIGHDWQFSPEQEKKLIEYYTANKLIIYCLNSSSNINPYLRQEIDKTLLLPIAEIEKRKHETAE